MRIVVAVWEQCEADGLGHCKALVLADGVLQYAAQLVGPVLIAQQQLYIGGGLQLGIYYEVLAELLDYNLTNADRAKQVSVVA